MAPTSSHSFSPFIPSEEALRGSALPDKSLRVATTSASLGGVESLMVRPAAAVHSALTPEEREKTGVTDGLIRFSAGIEATEDLLADLHNALKAIY